MAVSLFGNAMWQLVKESDAMTWLVLGTLLIMSVACWTIFLYKFLLLRIKRRQLKQAFTALRTISNQEQIWQLTRDTMSSMPRYFLGNHVAYIESLTRKNDTVGSLSLSQWDLVSDHADRLVDDMVSSEESYISVLATSAAIAPLLGLFGTVWGLIHAFVRISERQSADITTVAPGLAEALITTLVGLMVAIPALLMYNYLVSEVRSIEHALMRLSDQFSRIAQQFLL